MIMPCINVCKSYRDKYDISCGRVHAHFIKSLLVQEIHHKSDKVQNVLGYRMCSYPYNYA